MKVWQEPTGHLWYFFLSIKSTVQTSYGVSKCSKSNGLFLGICLYLRKKDSALYTHNCSGFLSGCPTTSYTSDKLFESMHHKLKRCNHSFCNIEIYNSSIVLVFPSELYKISIQILQ